MVKLKSICVSGGPEDAAPSRLKVWINRDDIDFAKADDLKPLQEWELAPDPECMIQYPTKYALCSRVALRGECSEARKPQHAADPGRLVALLLERHSKCVTDAPCCA